MLIIKKVLSPSCVCLLSQSSYSLYIKDQNLSDIYKEVLGKNISPVLILKLSTFYFNFGRVMNICISL